MRGWFPRRIRWQENQPVIEWRFLESHQPVEPFYEDTFTAHALTPLNQLLAFEMPLDDTSMPDVSIAPTGFIFHMSRCGSTLVNRMLASIPANLAYSEPQPVDAIVRSAGHEEEKIRWLQALIRLLGRQHSGNERHLYIKFDCWHTPAIPLIQRAFPDVPAIFLFRDPIEVLVSHQKLPGFHMVPGLISSDWYKPSANDSPPAHPQEYGAWVLGQICRAANEHIAAGKLHAIGYGELPDVMWKLLKNHFQAKYSLDEVSLMQAAGRQNSKNPNQLFSNDSKAKQDSATDQLRHLADKWATPYYNKLQKLSQ